MIPNIIHMFHDGERPLPEYAQSTVAWGDANGYEVIIHNANSLPSFNQKDWLIEHRQWSCLSDVARQWAVYNFGGFYLDTDCEIVGDLGKLMNRNWFATLEPPHFVNCAFSGGTAGNSISKKMFDAVSSFDFKGYTGKIPLPAYVGPWLQTKTFKDAGLPMSMLIPTSVGFGLNYTEYHSGRRDWPSDCIVRHHWAKSW